MRLTVIAYSFRRFVRAKQCLEGGWQLGGFGGILGPLHIEKEKKTPTIVCGCDHSFFSSDNLDFYNPIFRISICRGHLIEAVSS